MCEVSDPTRRHSYNKKDVKSSAASESKYKPSVTISIIFVIVPFNYAIMHQTYQTRQGPPLRGTADDLTGSVFDPLLQFNFSKLCTTLEIPPPSRNDQIGMTVNINDCCMYESVTAFQLSGPRRSNFGRGRIAMSLGPQSCSTATYFPKRPVPSISTDGCLRTSSPTLTVSSPPQTRAARVCVFVCLCNVHDDEADHPSG